MATIKNPTRKLKHDRSLHVEFQLKMDNGIGFYVPSSFDEKPDMICDDGEVIDVKTIDEIGKASMSRANLENWADEYDDFVLAMWNDNGRVKITPQEALERGRFARSRYGDEEIVVIQMGDELHRFVNPFPSVEFGAPPNALDDENLALTLDGRAVPQWRTRIVEPGVRQENVFKLLRLRGGATTLEVGVLCHALAGHCPEYQRDEHFKAPYSGSACCRKAADHGADVMYDLRAQGRVWKGDDGIWHLFTEDPERWQTS